MLVTLSLLATLIGPGYSIALADKGMNYGYLYFFIFCFFSVQYVLTGLYFAPRLQEHTDCHSLGDVLRKAYGSHMQVVVGIVSLVLTVAFSAIMAKVGGSILSGILDIEFNTAVLIVTFIGVLYAVTGGLKAVIYTEVVQAVLILVATILLLMFMLEEKQVPVDWMASALASTDKAIESHTVISLIGLSLAFLLGEFLIPPYANRAFASRTKSIASKSFIAAGIMSAVWFFIVVTIGVLSAYFINQGGDQGAFIGSGFAVLPSGLLGLFVVALASIVMSTQESLFNAGATSFVRDIMRNDGADEVKDLASVRIVTLFVSASAVFVAIYAPNILSILLAGYAVWVPIVAVPLAWYLLTGKTDIVVAYSSVIVGGVLSISSMVIDPAAIENGLAVFVGVFGNAVGAAFGLVFRSKRG